MRQHSVIDLRNRTAEQHSVIDQRNRTAEFNKIVSTLLGSAISAHQFQNSFPPVSARGFQNANRSISYKENASFSASHITPNQTIAEPGSQCLTACRSVGTALSLLEKQLSNVYL